MPREMANIIDDCFCNSTTQIVSVFAMHDSSYFLSLGFCERERARALMCICVCVCVEVNRRINAAKLILYFIAFFHNLYCAYVRILENYEESS